MPSSCGLLDRLTRVPFRFGYCIKVYVTNYWSDDHNETQSSAGLPSYTTSVRTRSARAVYRRVRKVLYLQWRGIAIVLFILVDVTFFSIVFIYLNSVQSSTLSHLEKTMPYVACLIEHPTEADKCYAQGQALFVNMSTLIAILIMLSVSRKVADTTEADEGSWLECKHSSCLFEAPCSLVGRIT